MNPSEKIKEMISKSDVTIDSQAKKRILDDALEQLKQKYSAGTRPNIWRIIMRSRISKLAAAAAIIIVLLAFDPFGIMNSGGVAWAKVAQRVEQIETFMFGMTIKVSDPNSNDSTDQTTAKWIIYLSEKYGFRMDIGAGENFVSWYVAPDANEMIMVVPGEKELIKWPLPADIRKKMPEEYRDPREYISRFMSRPYKELGRSVINGVQVEGIEVKNPPTDGEQLEDAVGRLWVDTETELPVRIEIEGTADGKMVQWIMDFKWAEAVDSSLFDPYRSENR
jgi:outer membrane lipoprotein-sorting protein